MRSAALALVALALTASPASAAGIELEDRSSPEDNDPTIAIVVRAAPGETNLMTVRLAPGGIVIEDTGAPLTGECEPSGTGRFCRGDHFGVVDRRENRPDQQDRLDDEDEGPGFATPGESEGDGRGHRSEDGPGESRHGQTLEGPDQRPLRRPGW